MRNAQRRVSAESGHVANSRTGRDHLSQRRPFEFWITAVIQRFMLRAEHALQVLTLLPGWEDLEFTLGVGRTLTLVVSRQFIAAAEAFEREGGLERLFGEALQLPGRYLEAGDPQRLGCRGIEGGGGCVSRRVVHRREIEPPIGVVPVAEQLGWVAVPRAGGPGWSN